VKNGFVYKACFILVVLFLISISALAKIEDNSIDPSDPSYDPKAEEEAWKEYEEATKKAGAGEVVPLPDDEEPWKKICPPGQYCPSVADGIFAGLHWCLPNKKGGKPPKCYFTQQNKSFKIYMKFLAWIEKYTGGKAGLFMAGTIRTESEGVTFSKTKSKTQECGLASIDNLHAQKADVNACQPEANIYASGYFRNLRLIKLRERWPQVTQAPLEQQWLLAGACGAIGSNKVDYLIQRSGALRTNDDGTLKYSKPHDRVLKWGHWADKTGKGKFYTYDVYSMLARNPGRVFFRFARGRAGVEIFSPMYPNGIPWTEPIIPVRPANLLPYPGDSKHCKCYLWPELEGQVPSIEENQEWIDRLGEDFPLDPTTLGEAWGKK